MTTNLRRKLWELRYTFTLSAAGSLLLGIGTGRATSHKSYALAFILAGIACEVAWIAAMVTQDKLARRRGMVWRNGCWQHPHRNGEGTRHVREAAGEVVSTESIGLIRRSTPEYLRWLAARLLDGSLSPEGVAFALEVKASLLETEGTDTYTFGGSCDEH